MTNVKATQPVRPKRVPVSGHRDILSVQDKDPNYVYRWVLDDNNRIERYKQGGYEVVVDPLKVGQESVNSGTQLGSEVTKYAGQGKTLVLMRLSKEWYDADQAAKQEAVNASEAEIHNTTRQQGFYGAYSPQKRR